MLWETMTLERLDISFASDLWWRNCKQEGNVRLNDGVVTKWPFSTIIRLIQPIKFVMAKCQSLHAICNHDSRRLPRAFRAFVQMSLFQLYCHFLSLACWVFRCLMPPLCYQHKSDTFTYSAVCNKIWSFHGCLNRNLFSKKSNENMTSIFRAKVSGKVIVLKIK